jgi:hypothetical protein
VCARGEHAEQRGARLASGASPLHARHARRCPTVSVHLFFYPQDFSVTWPCFTWTDAPVLCAHPPLLPHIRRGGSHAPLTPTLQRNRDRPGVLATTPQPLPPCRHADSGTPLIKHARGLLDPGDGGPENEGRDCNAGAPAATGARTDPPTGPPRRRHPTPALGSPAHHPGAAIHVTGSYAVTGRGRRSRRQGCRRRGGRRCRGPACSNLDLPSFLKPPPPPLVGAHVPAR